MKRLFVVFLVAGMTIWSTAAIARLSRGDKNKLGRYLSVALNPFAEEKDRQEQWQEFTDFFGERRNEKDLAEVDDLAELLAGSSDRPNQRSGQYMMKCDLSKLGGRSTEKWDLYVNVPKKYSSSSSSDPWPLIVVLPDKGQDLKAVMDEYWANEEIRDGFLIAVISMDYSEIEEQQTKEVKDDDGKIKLEPVTVKVPFHWDSKQALRRFYVHLFNLQLREFKVDPNRIVLDGVGMGRDGALAIGCGSAWRFGGLVDRGVALDSPALQNLSHLRVLYYPAADEASMEKKPGEMMKKAVGESLTVAGGDDAWSATGEKGGESLFEWLNACRRERYPLPSKWTIAEDSQQFGYWAFVTKRFEMDRPSEITVSSDRGSNTITVKTNNVAQFTLFLNDRIADLAEPVKLVVNDENATEMDVKRSADLLLAHAFAHPDGREPRDPGCVFTAEIRNVDVTPPPAPKEDDDGGDNGKGK